MIYVCSGGAPDKLRYSELDNHTCIDNSYWKDHKITEFINNLGKDDYMTIASEDHFELIESEGVTCDFDYMDSHNIISCNSKLPHFWGKNNLDGLPSNHFYETKYYLGKDIPNTLDNVICKPINSSGSRGIVAICSKDEFSKHRFSSEIKLGREYLDPNANYAVQELETTLEKYLSIEAFVMNGKVVDYYIEGAEGKDITNVIRWKKGRIYHNKNYINQVIEILNAIRDKLDVEYGIFNCEGFVVDGNIKVFEINTRYNCQLSHKEDFITDLPTIPEILVQLKLGTYTPKFSEFCNKLPDGIEYRVLERGILIDPNKIKYLQ